MIIITVVAAEADMAYQVMEEAAAEAAVLMDPAETVIRMAYMAEAAVLVEIMMDIHSL